VTLGLQRTAWPCVRVFADWPAPASFAHLSLVGSSLAHTGLARSKPDAASDHLAQQDLGITTNSAGTGRLAQNIQQGACGFGSFGMGHLVQDLSEWAPTA